MVYADISLPHLSLKLGDDLRTVLHKHDWFTTFRKNLGPYKVRQILLSKMPLILRIFWNIFKLSILKWLFSVYTKNMPRIFSWLTMLVMEGFFFFSPLFLYNIRHVHENMKIFGVFWKWGDILGVIGKKNIFINLLRFEYSRLEISCSYILESFHHLIV